MCETVDTSGLLKPGRLPFVHRLDNQSINKTKSDLYADNSATLGSNPNHDRFVPSNSDCVDVTSVRTSCSSAATNDKTTPYQIQDVLPISNEPP